MRVIHKLGPEDHGRAISLEEFAEREFQPGYHFEVIDGRLYVSPEANLPEIRLERWLYRKLDMYSRRHEEVINFVYPKTRVFVPDRPDLTIPEPDIAAYRHFPDELPLDEVNWEDVSPLIVAEILHAGDPAKDLTRNVELYLQVISIKEYWILDAREAADRPMLRVYRRRGGKWSETEVGFGGVYTTRILPGFRLKVDPRS